MHFFVSSSSPSHSSFQGGFKGLIPSIALLPSMYNHHFIIPSCDLFRTPLQNSYHHSYQCTFTFISDLILPFPNLRLMFNRLLESQKQLTSIGQASPCWITPLSELPVIQWGVLGSDVVGLIARKCRQAGTRDFPSRASSKPDLKSPRRSKQAFHASTIHF